MNAADKPWKVVPEIDWWSGRKIYNVTDECEDDQPLDWYTDEREAQAVCDLKNDQLDADPTRARG